MTETITAADKEAIARERLRAYEAERYAADLDRAVAIAWEDVEAQKKIEHRMAQLNEAITIHHHALEDLGVKP